MASAPFVDCPEHGLVPARGMGMSGNATLVSANSWAECSVCGRSAPVVDGSYQDHGDHMHFDIVLTADQWRRFGSAIAQAQQELKSGMKPKNVDRRLRESAAAAGPEAESLLTKFARPGSVAVATWLGVLAAIVMPIVTEAIASDSDQAQEQIIKRQDEIVGEYQRLLREAEQRQQTPTAPTSPPAPRTRSGPPPP